MGSQWYLLEYWTGRPESVRYLDEEFGSLSFEIDDLMGGKKKIEC